MYVGLALALLVAGPAAIVDAETMTLSIPAPQIAKDERIVGFELHLTSARVAAMPNVPIGWFVTVDNEPSWNTSMKGSSTVGAAALSADFLTRFLTIEREQSLGIPLDVVGEIVVTKDFVTERRIKIGLKDIATRKTGTTGQRVRK